jgi:hypothetical protein
VAADGADGRAPPASMTGIVVWLSGGVRGPYWGTREREKSFVQRLSRYVNDASNITSTIDALAEWLRRVPSKQCS